MFTEVYQAHAALSTPRAVHLLVCLLVVGIVASPDIIVVVDTIGHQQSVRRF